MLDTVRELVTLLVSHFSLILTSSFKVVDVCKVQGTLTVTENAKLATGADVQREAVALYARELFHSLA